MSGVKLPPEDGPMAHLYLKVGGQRCESLATEDHAPRCPKCQSKNFDGWKCRDCDYKIPEKHKKAHGQLLGAKGAANVRASLATGEEPKRCPNCDGINYDGSTCDDCEPVVLP